MTTEQLTEGYRKLGVGERIESGDWRNAYSGFDRVAPIQVGQLVDEWSGVDFYRPLAGPTKDGIEAFCHECGITQSESIALLRAVVKNLKKLEGHING